MPSMTERRCRNPGCGKVFQARTADVKRGWAKFCSKSCKAVEQERRTGQHAAYKARRDSYDDEHEAVGHIFESGYFGHGQS